MIFVESKLKGAYLIKLDRTEDERGYFVRDFCKKEFEDFGLEHEIVQCNISYNAKRGTLRGMHFQSEPFEECKIVSCIKGSFFDVIIDLRETSKTYLKWEGFLLTEEGHEILYIPKGFAHGFQTLEDNTKVYYRMTQRYCSDYASGVRWDDEVFNIKWPPCNDRIISIRDRGWGDYRP
jgi:dTDP-4-dehydrorhamnose 3,5-epimerase